MPRRKTLLVLTFLLSSLIIFNVSTNDELIKSVEASPTTIIVPSLDYPTIQEAINKANASDTILVMPGIYHEHINISKSIKLKGENSLTTIIDGEEKNQTIINVIASNIQIEDFTIKNGSKYYGPPHYAYGIQIMNRINVTIRNNIITKTTLSIFLSNSNSCNIINNKIIDNYNYGIQFSDSCFNNVVANNIINNPGGIYITSGESKNNTLYRNNFIANTDPAPLPRGSATKWDNGAEGNYWDDYHGVDADGDGIGDDPYPEDWPQLALDKYPLIEPWSVLRIHNIPLNGQSYNVTTYCNSTVASFIFTQPEKQISFNVTGPSGAVSFCNITIPKVLLNASSGNWTVSLNDENLTEFLVGENATHTYIYFMISLNSTCKVTIVGTDVIPEFPIRLLFPIFIIVTLIAIFFAKRRNRIYLDRNLQDS
jgi:parallel beta-helix repeat protein